ncbi:uncharacterized protein LOC126284887 [Schistocerca gregaria]|uniref:uncharacterized protein LOC126284887 n=1 Tax=Schistocerca gregaria TaxID=7010 RepID=UPI00211ECBEE|nr:uncharacterized protein LOC126284887 [Schistocerca gregaria]
MDAKQVNVIALLISGLILCASAMPQGGADATTEGPPMPYNFEWKVEDAPTNNYYGQQESGNEAGRVEGKYYVLLPDKRLQTVTYYVEGDSGFRIQISYEQNANPLGVK